jgi:3-dehydroquinate dehydratase/shikimate dehydrogenase
LRLDQWSHWSVADIKTWLQKAHGPVLLTLRQSARVQDIERLLALEPPYFDLDGTLPASLIERMIERYPQTRFIVSKHLKSIEELEKSYRDLSQYAAFQYKLAVATPRATDALRALLFAREHPRASVICMGERASFARVLGPIFGNQIGFAHPDGEPPAAPGQLPYSEMNALYQYSRLNAHTEIYALIGDPVAHSIGHRHHNAVFQQRRRNAVYVKIPLLPAELQEFLAIAKHCPFHGLSVTTPLKESICAYTDVLDPFARRAGAVNTLRFRDGKICGANTDGIGALEALERQGPVRGKTILLLGAGGAARAIAWAARERGAIIAVHNRSIGRAQDLATAVGGSFGTLENLPARCDAIVCCLSESLPLDLSRVPQEAVAMDIVYAPRDTPFLRAAAARGCRLVYGEEMFTLQAAAQTQWWFDGH